MREVIRAITIPKMSRDSRNSPLNHSNPWASSLLQAKAVYTAARSRVKGGAGVIDLASKAEEKVVGSNL